MVSQSRTPIKRCLVSVPPDPTDPELVRAGDARWASTAQSDAMLLNQPAQRRVADSEPLTNVDGGCQRVGMQSDDVSLLLRRESGSSYSARAATATCRPKSPSTC